MKKTIYYSVLFVAIIGFFVTKTGYYRVQDVSNNKILVNRKGSLILLYAPVHNYNINDSIKLYGDYDFNWNLLTIKN